MSLRFPLACGVAALLLLPGSPAGAEEAEAPADAPTETLRPADPGAILGLTFENDIFSNLDQHYTNGLRLSYTTSETGTPSWLAEAARAFPLFPDAAPVRANFAIGQSIFTPQDTDARVPDPDDRPYAGWLYASVGLMADSGRRLDQLELQIGVIGPWSLAEEVQNGTHFVIGDEKAKGWDSQIGNEVGVVLSYERSWRSAYSGSFVGLDFDVMPSVGASLGNVLTQAEAGAMLRLGEDLPLDYGPPRISPGLPGSDFFIPTGDFGWYFFAGIEGRAVARNIFLDGNTWKDSASVDKHIFVGDIQAGIAVTYGNVRLAYTHVLRSPEFQGDKAINSFGGLSLSWRF